LLCFSLNVARLINSAVKPIPLSTVKPAQLQRRPITLCNQNSVKSGVTFRKSK
jgi:hypothetical protein